MIERCADKRHRIRMAHVAVLPGLRGRMARCFAHGAGAVKRTAVASIAAQRRHVAVVECGGNRERVRRYSMTQHALRAGRNRDVTRRFIRHVTTVTSGSNAGVVERDAGERGGAGVAGVAVLSRLGRRVGRCFAHQPHGHEHATMTGITTDGGNVVVIEVGSLRKRLRCHLVTQNALGTRWYGNVQRRFVAEVAGVAAGGNASVIKRGAGK